MVVLLGFRPQALQFTETAVLPTGIFQLEMTGAKAEQQVGRMLHL